MGDFRRACEVSAVAGVALLFAAGLWGYLTLPASIPTRFDLAGHAVAWGPKWTVMTLPLTGAALVTVLWFLGKLDLRPNLMIRIPEENVAHVKALSRELMAVLPPIFVAGFIAMEIATILGAKAPSSATAIVPISTAMVAAAFACIGTYIVRMYRAALS